MILNFDKEKSINTPTSVCSGKCNMCGLHYLRGPYRVLYDWRLYGMNPPTTCSRMLQDLPELAMIVSNNEVTVNSIFSYLGRITHGSVSNNGSGEYNLPIDIQRNAPVPVGIGEAASTITFLEKISSSNSLICNLGEEDKRNFSRIIEVLTGLDMATNPITKGTWLDPTLAVSDLGVLDIHISSE